MYIEIANKHFLFPDNRKLRQQSRLLDFRKHLRAVTRFSPHRRSLFLHECLHYHLQRSGTYPRGDEVTHDP